MTAYTDRLHIAAREAADFVLDAAALLDPKGQCPAEQLAMGVVADAVASTARCCPDDQLGFAVMLAGELAARASAGTTREVGR